MAFSPSITYSGLIVDVRGTRYRPSLATRILENNRVVYDKSLANYQIYLSQGPVSYAADADEAITSPLVGPNPFAVKAAGVNPSERSEIYVDKDSADRIDQIDRQQRILEYCRVIVLVGEETMAWLRLQPWFTKEMEA